MLVEERKDHEKEAARLRQLAIEQDNKSKGVQEGLDMMKEDGKKACEKAREILLKRQTEFEASLLREKSRLKETLNENLEETEYGDDPASDSDKEVEPGTSSQGCDQIVLTLQPTAPMPVLCLFGMRMGIHRGSPLGDRSRGGPLGDRPKPTQSTWKTSGWSSNQISVSDINM